MELTDLNHTRLSMNGLERRMKIVISRELWKRVGGWPKQKIRPETGMINAPKGSSCYKR